MTPQVSTTSVFIERRFCGPPESANGGYTAGRLAALVGAPAEVTLRRPPPLERHMPVENDADRLLLMDGDAVVAEAVSTAVNVSLPACPDLQTAQAASDRHPAFDRHPFPDCFVCGPQRTDGLGLYAGPLPNEAVWAAVWSSPETGTGEATDVLCWAAMDCPTGWAVNATDPDGVYVLGRMAGTVIRPVDAGPIISLGWCISRSERKATAAAALFTPDGVVLAYSAHTWIRLRG